MQNILIGLLLDTKCKRMLMEQQCAKICSLPQCAIFCSLYDSCAKLCSMIIIGHKVQKFALEFIVQKYALSYQWRMYYYWTQWAKECFVHKKCAQICSTSMCGSLLFISFMCDNMLNLPHWVQCAKVCSCFWCAKICSFLSIKDIFTQFSQLTTFTHFDKFLLLLILFCCCLSLVYSLMSIIGSSFHSFHLLFDFAVFLRFYSVQMERKVLVIIRPVLFRCLQLVSPISFFFFSYSIFQAKGPDKVLVIIWTFSSSQSSTPLVFAFVLIYHMRIYIQELSGSKDYLDLGVALDLG